MHRSERRAVGRSRQLSCRYPAMQQLPTILAPPRLKRPWERAPGQPGNSASRAMGRDHQIQEPRNDLLAGLLACLPGEPCSEGPPEVGDGSRHAKLLRCRASQADQGAVRGPRSWAALSSRVVVGSGSQPRRREEGGGGGDEARRRENAKMGPFPA